MTKHATLCLCTLSLSLLVSGCIATRYDHYGNENIGYAAPYAATTSSSWLITTSHEDYVTPFYISGGVNYYPVSGGYVYFVNGRRHFVSRLPRGGYYNRRHPLYGR